MTTGEELKFLIGEIDVEIGHLQQLKQQVDKAATRVPFEPFLCKPKGMKKNHDCSRPATGECPKGCFAKFPG